MDVRVYRTLESYVFFFFSSRRRHTRLTCDWSSDVCSSDLIGDQIERIDEVGKRGDQRDPHIGRRPTIERAVIDGERLLGERGVGHDTAELAPKMAQHAFFVPLQV